MAQLLAAIILLPLIGGVFNACFGSRLPRPVPAILASGAVIGSFLACLGMLPEAAEGARTTLFTWLNSGGFRADVGLLFDPLSSSMALMVTGVASLIHLYAAGYMEEDEDQVRFFALLNLFVFAMLMIVLADNLLLMFLGWEGVGFCSYGLIGFWYRKSENADAGRKAFIVTRIGDLFFTIAVLWLFALLGTIGIEEINSRVLEIDPTVVTIISLLLLGGACGKSAQLPLMSWLPDAMAGPTPVSALIHAATMVTAGVYLLCRLFPLVSLSPIAMGAIALVGALTALYAATSALCQREIKRVLAFSTMSQVGYMFMAVGVGSVSAAMFHLLTHAFFKALLFMGAGCLIHLAGHENDIFEMGGMRKFSKPVFWLFMAGLFCLAGAPLTGGFFSKDLILATAYAHGDSFHLAIYGLGVLTALLTSFYSFRLAYLVFAGDYRGEAHPHSLPKLMVWTLPLLALFGLGAGLFNLPHLFGGHSWLSGWFGRENDILHLSLQTEYQLIATAVGVFVIGWLIAHFRYRTYSGPEYNRASEFLLSAWYVDALYDRLLVRPFDLFCRFCWQGGEMGVINGVLDGLASGSQGWSRSLRALSDGKIPRYLQGFAWGFLLIVGWFLLKAVAK
ncbi:NADH dehydrogenase subunit L [Malonomonas rubra DSM 5091]|uniref:NADH dehydrogenase subunit L n=1 Tax=Malonomonas rubra DSM 5091 TaxID=1122189 RepID=A0A1M6FM14_MALRU|nr:NADH-quinone oxidoreductase subunit L [Malonomonas rubra]SHI98740.1 NADH dehydrogenase subunit L [Malonomonas rubra DSM 5091]